MMDHWISGEVHALGSRFRGTKVVLAECREAGKEDRRCRTSKDALEQLLGVSQGGTLSPKGAVGDC